MGFDADQRGESRVLTVLHIALATGEFRPGRYMRDDVTGWIRVETISGHHP